MKTFDFYHNFGRELAKSWGRSFDGSRNEALKHMSPEIMTVCILAAIYRKLEDIDQGVLVDINRKVEAIGRKIRKPKAKRRV